MNLEERLWRVVEVLREWKVLRDEMRIGVRLMASVRLHKCAIEHFPARLHLHCCVRMSLSLLFATCFQLYRRSGLFLKI